MLAKKIVRHLESISTTGNTDSQKMEGVKSTIAPGRRIKQKLFCTLLQLATT